MSDTRISSFGAEEPTAHVVEELLQEGVVILEDLLAEEVVDRLNEELLPHFDAPQSGGDVYPTASQDFGATPARHVPATASGNPAPSRVRQSAGYCR